MVSQPCTCRTRHGSWEQSRVKLGPQGLTKVVSAQIGKLGFRKALTGCTTLSQNTAQEGRRSDGAMGADAYSNPLPPPPRPGVNKGISGLEPETPRTNADFRKVRTVYA
eukprot:1193337-Prorocentrum_minimum.AAC.3